MIIILIEKNCFEIDKDFLFLYDFDFDLWCMNYNGCLFFIEELINRNVFIM